MVYISQYESPLGNILIAVDYIGITGLWFEWQNALLLIKKMRLKKKQIL